MEEFRENARNRLICALILVDCLITKDAPNGLICMGQQLASLKLHCWTRDSRI